MAAARLHVVQCVASLDPAQGGTTRSVLELSKALLAAGIESSVWTPAPQSENWIGSVQAAGVHVAHGPLEPLTNGSGLVLHCHGVWLPSNHQVAVFAAKRRVPRVVSPRGMLEPWALAHRRWKKRVAWALYQRRDLRRASAIHATSDMEAENLRRLDLGCPVFTAANGVDDPGPNWKAAPADYSPGGERKAVFLSRIHPKKGLPLLAEAWARVRPPDWRMVVVGPDEEGHRADLEALIAKLGLSNTWEFRDAVSGDAKWRLLANAELSILPTYSENFGNVVPESLLVGTPVITTTGAPWDGLVDHRCGWWVEPSTDGIATALRSATALPLAELRAMGYRGRAWASGDFAWEGIAQRMIAAYEEAHSRYASKRTRNSLPRTDR